MDINKVDAGIALGLSMFCGIASYMQGVREGRNNSLAHFVTELANSLVAGATAFCGGEYEGLNQYLTLLMVLICANNATEVKQKCREQIQSFEVAKLLSLFKKGPKP